MAESIVKVPSQEAQGLDFLAFSFNGKHGWDDFHIYRTSDGDRYNENLTPTLADKTAEVPGGDGMYYFGTTHKQRDFNISFAFDSLTEVQLRELKKWLNGKEMGDLWFQEAPYKVWTAKPAGNSSIKYIPFDDENGQRVYKGEGTVQFVAYWPYAHTPDWVAYTNSKGTTKKDGRLISSYEGFNNIEGWKDASALNNSTTVVKGDLPATFVLNLPGEHESEEEIKVGNHKIILKEDCTDLSWNSKNGIVSGKVSNGKGGTFERAVRVDGNSLVSIETGRTVSSKTVPVYNKNIIILNLEENRNDQEIHEEYVSINLPLYEMAMPEVQRPLWVTLQVQRETSEDNINWQPDPSGVLYYDRTFDYDDDISRQISCMEFGISCSQVLRRYPMLTFYARCVNNDVNHNHEIFNRFVVTINKITSKDYPQYHYWYY